ncbi:hypothetical protein JCM3775_004959 [Rhodotorula graminis]
MLFKRALFLLATVAPFLAAAQLLDDGFPIAGFPEQCNIACQPLQETLTACPAVGNDIALAKAYACACASPVVDQVERCGSCVFTSTSSTSRAFVVAEELAIAYARACGVSLNIYGTSTSVSSVLRDGGASYSSERAAMSSKFAAATAAAATRTSSPASSAVLATSTSGLTSATGSVGAAVPRYAQHSTRLCLEHTPATADHDMSTPDKIASTGSLQDRLKRLGLQGSGSPTGPPSSPSPSSSSTASKGTPIRTGATLSVSDKRSRFAAGGGEDKPLLPQGGSFGFAPAKPRASGGGDRFDVKPRVASLGAGRAPVPLDVVKPRSVSAGHSPATSESGSAPGSRVMSREGSTREGSNVEEPVEPVDATPVPSPSQPTSARLNSLSLPSGLRTPGAMSVSSMRVETGSIGSTSSIEGGPDPADIDVQASLAARDMADSPLSSPVLAGIAIPAPSEGSISSMDGVAPALKGPLDSLRASSPRPGSIRSISSLSVEAASEDVADLSEMSTNGSAYGGASTPTIELTGLGLEHGAGSANGDGERASGEGEAQERARHAQMSAELAKYESDERDPAALGPYQEDEPGGWSSGGENGESKEPPYARDERDEAELDVERPETPKPGARTPTSPIPGVKCSDCGEEVQLIELADHSCARSTLPPALSSPPSSPPAPEPAILSTHVSPPRTAPDVPEEPLDDDEPPTDDSISTPRRQKKRSNESGGEKLDAFVPQTDDLVPEDILDAYGDDHEDDGDEQPAAVDAQVASAPQDVADVPSDDLDTTAEPGAPRHDGQGVYDPEPMARSASTPGGAVARVRKASTKPRVQSAYGGSTKLPGRYYTSDDEMDGEPGSATIVRSPSSQRFDPQQ